MNIRLNHKGFTLVEMLLVLVIITSILLLMTGYLTTRIDESRRDRAVMQIEQILNAGLAYYINYSKWPDNINELQSAGYLPNKGTINNPWGREYGLTNNTTTGTFSVCSAVLGNTRIRSTPSGTPLGEVKTAVIESGIIAGRLPMAYSTGELMTGTATCPAVPPSTGPTTCDADECTIISTVNIPGQNLNNARSVNFAALYHNGACVPVPTCPLSMQAAIMVVPVSVTGNFDGNQNVYPLSSFTAFATPKSGKPVECFSRANEYCDETTSGDRALPPTKEYWRVCLDVVTEKGPVSEANSSTFNKDSGTIMAITRCVPTNEPVGSGFDVFHNQ